MWARTQFFEWLSRPYGLETFLRRPIKSLWRMIADTEEIADVEKFLEKYLVLSATCPIDKAVELALKRRTSLAYEPIIIEWADGRWRLLDMQVLLLAQSQLFALAVWLMIQARRRTTIVGIVIKLLKQFITLILRLFNMKFIISDILTS